MKLKCLVSQKYQNSRNSLRSLFQYYFKHDLEVNWYQDNQSEVDQMVAEIEDMIDEKVKFEINKLRDSLK